MATRERRKRSGASARAYTRAVDVFTLVSGGIVVLFLVGTVLLGVFSKRSALDILDWKPTRSPQVEAENEIDDVAQMMEAQNELRRRRGKPERTLEDVESEWRGS
jgi:hypothetical protein